MSTRHTSKGPPPASHYRRPEGYYYGDAPGYRGGPVGVADEGDDDDDDDETAVATDLSIMPPRTAQISRAGFRSNPISHQVEFDKEAAPATVPPGPRPKPKPRFEEPPRQPERAREREQEQRRPAPKQSRQPPPSRYTQPESDSSEEESDEDTVIESPPPTRRAPPQSHRSAPLPSRSSPAPLAQSQAYTRPPPPPQPQTYHHYPPPPLPHQAQALQYRQAPHGFSSLAHEPEDQVNSDDEDAFTAVGTGVATDLSFEDEVVPPRGGGGAGVVARGGTPQPRQQQPLEEYHRSLQRVFPARDASGHLAAVQHNSILRRPSPSSSASSSSSSAAPPPSLPQDSLVERELIQLLKDMNFSLALKDLHDHLGLGVQKTLVTEDGRGKAYCKVHCKKLPRHDSVEKEPHLKQHWVPLAGSRWEFRTSSHSVTVVWKTTAVGAYESAGVLGRR